MKALLLVIGKTDDNYLNEGITKYSGRITRYMPFELEVVPDIKNNKNLSENQQKEKEGELLLKKILPGDFVVLLDEKGKHQSSVEFANWLNTIFVMSYKRIVFIIGGPYGFSKNVYEKSNAKISLSKMTFSHQMVRLIFTEQFYRAHTILKGEPYHHI
ncbi:MAG: 23S rRNA (pseudouridine(1915)-N(3))-methyltransferase RlmH [Salinivirgaceae bacterium]|nr:23S rRNA (pseudouridine(1915)-N(3))-methyltransferase RlmH [Salinivirgaceae bacterium]